jgi:hypothetical protein
VIEPVEILPGRQAGPTTCAKCRRRASRPLPQANIAQTLDSWAGANQTVYNSWPGRPEIPAFKPAGNVQLHQLGFTVMLVP